MILKINSHSSQKILEAMAEKTATALFADGTKVEEYAEVSQAR